MGSLTLKGVRKSFGRREVLRNIDLTVESGEIVGLLGPNGSGKTTTLRIAAGFYAADAGSVEIDGRSITGAPKTRAQVGYLPERPPLYDALTVRQYMRFIASAKCVTSDRQRHVAAALDACQLQDVTETPIVRLSKGYRQRVGLAQAIIGSPQVLLLDEATNGLDPVQMIDTREMIRHSAQGRAVVFSSHIIQEVAALCTRVVIMCDGELVHVDRPGHDLDRTRQVIVEIDTDNPKQVINELGALDGMQEVSLTPHSKAPTGHPIRLLCSFETNTDLRDAIARTAIQHGKLLALENSQRSLEHVFIDHIERQRADAARLT